VSNLLANGLQYIGYALELSLITVLILRGWPRRHPAFFAYVASFAFVDAILRPTVLYTFGWTSFQYKYCYWITDLLLTLGAFLLISLFCRRAFVKNKERWSLVRTFLISVFILVAFISSLTMAQHYEHLATYFLVELSQNVYFACLVLNTVLYLALQYMEGTDEDLNLLVCGLGIEFAGPAASMALAYLTRGWQGGMTLADLVTQFCNLGMFLVWLYAATRKTDAEQGRVRGQIGNRPVPALLDTLARSAGIGNSAAPVLAHVPARGTR
jgi:hypothetical protein